MRERIVAMMVVALLTGCVTTTKVSLPSTQLSKEIFSPVNESGFLDLFTINPNPARQGSALRIDVRLRAEAKGSPWQSLGSFNSPRFKNTRFKLPVGNYLIRIEQGKGNIKDFTVRVDNQKHTMVYYCALLQTMEAPQGDGRGESTHAVGNWGGSVTLAVIFDYDVGNPISTDENELMKEMINSSWKKRAYAGFLLAQFGTQKSIPLLERFESDGVMGEVAKDAKRKILNREVSSHEKSVNIDSKSAIN